MSTNKYAIIVAGGSGSRMGTDIPKQFLPVAGMPVLMHTLLKFQSYSSSLQIILVLPENQMQAWESLCKKYSFEVVHEIVKGGNSRFQSVSNGLNAIHDLNGLVAIHDGVRPFVSKEIIENSFEVAEELGNAIVSVSMKDSIRMVEGEKSVAVDRSAYSIIQTPQTFKVSLIKKAFKVPELLSFTDDASVLEHYGEKINLIEGSYKNIKITTPEDMLLAEAIISHLS